jgi:hypothetical protein
LQNAENFCKFPDFHLLIIICQKEAYFSPSGIFTTKSTTSDVSHKSSLINDEQLILFSLSGNIHCLKFAKSTALDPIFAQMKDFCYVPFFSI